MSRGPGVAEREILTGRGHTIPATGEMYNDRLERFLERAERDYDA